MLSNKKKNEPIDEEDEYKWKTKVQYQEEIG